MAWKPNPGHRPRECEITDEDGNVTGYRRVHVRLRNGIESRVKSPGGWASGGRGGCNWTDTKHAFDIVEWELV